MDLNSPTLNELLDLWLKEDIGRGDLTSIVVGEGTSSAHWIAKQKGVFCSGPIIKRLFARLHQSVKIELLIKDGESFKSGQKLLNLTGPKSVLLSGERTALNLAMHLSGIATATAKLVAELDDSSIKLVDTRKTTPGLRLLEKYAVKCGGGINHRMGLDDAAMLKENHIAWSAGITQSIKVLRKSIPWPARIIVEAETENQAKDAVNAGADGVLLDEMSLAKIIELVPRLRELAAKPSQDRMSSQIVIEISGINPTEINKYASSGVDLISTSAPITKSSWIDFSMRFNENTNK